MEPKKRSVVSAGVAGAGVVTFAATTPPDVAGANLSKWLALVGIETTLPPWVDTAARAAAAIMLLAAVVLWQWPRLQRLWAARSQKPIRAIMTSDRDNPLGAEMVPLRTACRWLYERLDDDRRDFLRRRVGKLTGDLDEAIATWVFILVDRGELDVFGRHHLGYPLEKLPRQTAWGSVFYSNSDERALDVSLRQIDLKRVLDFLMELPVGKQ